jgi:hypothetical protein
MCAELRWRFVCRATPRFSRAPGELQAAGSPRRFITLVPPPQHTRGRGACKGLLGHTPWMTLEVEEEDRRERSENGERLKRKYRQSLLRSFRQPFDGEERDERKLRDHEQLPDMSSGALVGFTGDARASNVQ